MIYAMEGIGNLFFFLSFLCPFDHIIWWEIVATGHSDLKIVQSRGRPIHTYYILDRTGLCGANYASYQDQSKSYDWFTLVWKKLVHSCPICSQCPGDVCKAGPIMSSAKQDQGLKNS